MLRFFPFDRRPACGYLVYNMLSFGVCCRLTSHQILGDSYLWFWLTPILSFLIYVPSYFNIIVSEKAWWKVKVRRVAAPWPQTACVRSQLGCTILILIASSNWLGTLWLIQSSFFPSASCVGGYSIKPNVEKRHPHQQRRHCPGTPSPYSAGRSTSCFS